MRLTLSFAHKVISMILLGSLVLLLAACGGTGGGANQTSSNNGTTPHTGATSTPAHPAGTITEFPIPTSGSQPDAITAGPDGNLWFTENGQIGRITTGK